MKNKKTVKKIISLALAVILLLALVPMTLTVSAEEITIREIATGLEYYDIVIMSLNDGLAVVFTEDWQFGVIDKTGNIVIPVGMYALQSSLFREGLAVVWNEDRQDGIIDITGNIVVPFGTYDTISSLSEGLAVVWNEDRQVGVVDTTGNIVVPFGTFNGIDSFSDGLAAVQNEDRQLGYIDKTGNMVVPFGTYRYGNSRFSEGLAFVLNEDEQVGVIDKTGNIVIPFGTYTAPPAFILQSYGLGFFSDGLAVVRRSGEQKTNEIGVMDKAGNMVVPFDTYNNIGSFSEGLAFVQNGGQVGAIDKAGNIVIPFGTYDSIGSFNDGMAVVSKDEQTGVIDRSGNIVVPFGTYDRIGGFVFNEGLSAAKKADGTWSILEISGNAAANPAPISQTARPTSAAVLVNGEDTSFEAYNIEGNNYFKLRDLAFVLSGTDKQFNVGWDRENNAISLTSSESYDIVGGEMAESTAADNLSAAPTASTIYLDGEQTEFTAYLIGGNNYFKLRDIMEAFDVYVGWDGEANTITLDTSKGYED